ncbi:retron Ec78 anti-phage system effector HNH endonuclease PtuB [Vreelandella sp. 21]|uniref:retron Ec78 anti-phage system effector HNH endonuclease PtuB n=1 Tax=Vreelandella sp. 21 TaxID=3402864 RepID=UPI003D9A4147
MKKLYRPEIGPACLNTFDHNIHVWSSMKNKKQVWEKLEEMQDGFCCYCESFAYKGNGHIEHFFHKGEDRNGYSPYKHLTFNWENLFGSCGLDGGDRCGHYKDKKGQSGPGDYNPCDIIKPDLDNPEDFFEYLPTGIISVKESLSCNDKKRANETLRVLNLNSLNDPRRNKIDIFKRELEYLLSLGADDDFLRCEVNVLKENIVKSEYRTAIMFVLFGGV